MARQLRGRELAGRTIAIKVRFADFTTITRSRTLAQPTDVARDIYATARRALRRPRPGPGPASAWSGSGSRAWSTGRRWPTSSPSTSGPEAWREAERAADRAADRFGREVVRPASLVEAPDP